MARWQCLTQIAFRDPQEDVAFRSQQAQRACSTGLQEISGGAASNGAGTVDASPPAHALGG